MITDAYRQVIAAAPRDLLARTFYDFLLFVLTMLPSPAAGRARSKSAPSEALPIMRVGTPTHAQLIAVSQTASM
ncbi:hypothetical protein [Bradyrhizobium sp. dw_411]|uniref:hypothetical protein n=1 Tax=Bradyrhizobium sp. dw_411 TaxID=2720082 RepID=UPI001BCA96AB|nr:hypothetical protein [Bradyrhizobium sp. dw_411]